MKRIKLTTEQSDKLSSLYESMWLALCCVDELLPSSFREFEDVLSMPDVSFCEDDEFEALFEGSINAYLKSVKLSNETHTYFTFRCPGIEWVYFVVGKDPDDFYNQTKEQLVAYLAKYGDALLKAATKDEDQEWKHIVALVEEYRPTKAIRLTLKEASMVQELLAQYAVVKKCFSRKWYQENNLSEVDLDNLKQKF